MSERVELAGGRAVLYWGDCLEVMPGLEPVDHVITDPPYGVHLGSNGPTSIGKTKYLGFDDSPEFVRSVCVPAIRRCIEMASSVVITPGIRNCFAYPEPDEIGAIYNPAGAGFSRWGFTCSQPILYYGKDPVAPNKRPQSLKSTALTEKNGHPCPKPLSVMRWFVARCSKNDTTILDPFMGSGTTGVAALQLGRKFIGIELERKYFDIACERIEAAGMQDDLFGHGEPVKPEQGALI